MKEQSLLIVTDGQSITGYRRVGRELASDMQKFYHCFDGVFWEEVFCGTSMSDVEKAVIQAVRAAREQ